MPGPQIIARFCHSVAELATSVVQAEVQFYKGKVGAEEMLVERY